MRIYGQAVRESKPETIMAVLVDRIVGSQLVAVTGGAADWAVYEGPPWWAVETVVSRGHKVFPRQFEALGIVADAEALDRYRH